MEDIFSKANKSFFYEDTDFSAIRNDPFRFRCGIDILCVQGSALLSTGVKKYSIQPNDELLFLDVTLLQCVEATSDFKVRLLLFSLDLFSEVTTKIDISDLQIFKNSPLYHHPSFGNSWQNVNTWMDMAKMIYEDADNQIRLVLYRNFLQSYVMWLCSTIPTISIFNSEDLSHKDLIYQRFLSLVQSQSVRHHDVAYYAQMLSISSRYLNEIANDNGDNPKILIDEQLIAEIKSLLRFSELSIEGISARLCFPDPSYMSRFFKKYTKKTPREYRMLI
jgi:AraC family transcriptional regulator, transcriptional activator of pobA